MKATELRIGNWVKCLGATDGGAWFDYQVELKTFGYINNHGLKDFKPIPLTEEWLLEFGFKYSKVFQGYKINVDGYNHVVLLSDNSKLMLFGIPMHIAECKYVHQLQNLYFALTGEDLEIKKL